MDAESDIMDSGRVTPQRSPRDFLCPRAPFRGFLSFNLVVMLSGAFGLQGQPAEQTKPIAPANPTPSAKPAQPAATPQPAPGVVAPASPSPANAAPAQTPPVTPKLNNAAAEALRVQAEAGNALAQFKLGMLFASGKDVAQDLTLAAAWLRKSAEQGNAAAQFNLAVFYSQGVGVEKNFAEAANWFLKAAEQNDRAAQ